MNSSSFFYAVFKVVISTAKVIDAILRLKDEFSVTMDKATKSMMLSAKQAQRTGKQIESTGRSLGKVGSALTKSVTVPILATGAGLLKLASDFEDAENKIRAGTGKTGSSLSGLMNDFKTVYSALPSSMDDVSETITGVNQRLGLSGKPLQNVSEQVLRLTKLTGTDLATVIASSTRMLQDAGVKQQDYSKVLDYTYKVHQLTGVGLDVLQQKMAQFGSPLRQMGFDWQTSAAMLGKFEKEGVNTDLVVGSLRIGLGKMAKAGVKNPAAAFQTMVKQIKSAGTAGKANALALQYFGAKAGPDMAAAIREGHLDLNGLLTTLKNSPDTISKAASATLTPIQRLTKIGHQLQVSLQPVAQSLVTTLEKFEPTIEKMAGKVKQFADFLSKLTPQQKEMALKLALMAAAAGPVLKVLSPLVTGVGHISKSIGNFADAAKKAGSILGAIFTPGHVVVLIIIAIAVAALLIIKYWKPISAFFKGIWNGIMSVVKKVWAVIGPTIIGGVKTVQAYWNSIWPQLQQVFSNVWKGIQIAIMPLYIEFKMVLGFIQGAWKSALAVLKDTFKLAWDAVTGVFKIWWDVFSGLFKVILDIFTGRWSDAGKDFLKIFSNVGNDLKNLFGNLGRDALNWGGDIIKGLINGIKGAIGGLGDAVKNVANKIKSFLHFSKPDTGPLRDYEKWMPDFMKGLANGIDVNRNLVVKATQKVAVNMAGTVSPSGSGGVANVRAGGMNITIAKLADKIIVQNEEDIERFATAFVKKLKAAEANC